MFREFLSISVTFEVIRFTSNLYHKFRCVLLSKVRNHDQLLVQLFIEQVLLIVRYNDELRLFCIIQELDQEFVEFLLICLDKSLALIYDDHVFVISNTSDYIIPLINLLVL